MLGDDIATVMPGLRQQAESRMTCTVRIESVSVAPDASTGADVETVTTVHASLPCRIKEATRQVQVVDLQGASVTASGPEMHVPWDTAGLAVGQRAVITSVGALDRPSLLGTTYRLTGPSEGSLVTAQRWGVELWQAATT